MLTCMSLKPVLLLMRRSKSSRKHSKSPIFNLPNIHFLLALNVLFKNVLYKLNNSTHSNRLPFSFSKLFNKRPKPFSQNVHSYRFIFCPLKIMFFITRLHLRHLLHRYIHTFFAIFRLTLFST